MANFDLNDIIYSNRELNHALDFSSSIFILKEDGANVKFTMPYSSRYGNTEKIADGTPAFRNAMIMSPDGMMLMNYVINQQAIIGRIVRFLIAN